MLLASRHFLRGILALSFYVLGNTAFRNEYKQPCDRPVHCFGLDEIYPQYESAFGL